MILNKVGSLWTVSGASASIVVAIVAYALVRINFSANTRPLLYNNASQLPSYSDDLLHSWQPKVIIKNPSEWPGEGGLPYIDSDSQELQDKKFNAHFFNVIISDKIAFNRSIDDHRSKACKLKLYPEVLPSTSVIITFHNEAWSTLLRTVHSVFRTSPAELITEILLVDDKSSKAFLQEPLNDYISALSATIQIPIRVLRLSERKGLVGARLLGASEAKGTVLTFMESHCECNEGWLEPLLSRIAEDRTRIADPIIDMIADDTFAYMPASDKVWHGFDWRLQAQWTDVPERELKRRSADSTMPLMPPIQTGSVFSVDREFFIHLGQYDDAMKIYGIENIEFSIRAWSCGATLETVPCSRVGHVFRRDLPYSIPNGRDKMLNANIVRIVDLWYDEWTMFFYYLYPQTLEGKTGDVDARRELRKKLNCKSFRWYLENIYPETSIPQDKRHMGQVEHTNSYKCLDSTDIHSPFTRVEANLRHCFWNQHPHLAYQMFLVNRKDQITLNGHCLDYDKLEPNDSDKKVIFTRCSGRSSERWEYLKKSRSIVHLDTSTCLDYADPKMILKECNPKSRSQKWFMRNNFEWSPPSEETEE